MLTHPSLVAVKIDAPCRFDEFRDDAKGRLVVSPPDDLWPLCNLRAKVTWVRGDAHPTKVETIGVPAGLDRDIGMRPLVSVPRTRAVQQAKLVVRQVEQQPSHFQGEGGSSWTMFGVSTFVDSLGVVEDGEELHDLDAGSGLLGDPQPVFENPCRVRNPVIAIPRKDIRFKDAMENEGHVQRGHVNELSGWEAESPRSLA